MTNLAPIKFRNIFEKDGGPISEVYCRPEPIYSNFMGYEALAQIHNFSKLRADNKIYGNLLGCGFDQYRFIAIYKAIAEALERWAYFESIEEKIKSFGFDLDSTTSGMAAFPGLLPGSARQNAYFEGIERWSIVNWWHGFLPASELRIEDRLGARSIIEIYTPWGKECSVILVSTICPESMRNVYGFAASKSRVDALKKAQIELFRNYLLLDKIPVDTNADSLGLENINEKRLLYFSTGFGKEQFNQRLLDSKNLALDISKPKLIVDTEIPGPWSKYAYVWRCLFENKIDSHLSDDIEEFFF